MKRITGVAVLLLLLMALAPVNAADGKLEVVVTINVLQDIVEQIGGEHVEAISIVTGLETPHTYATTMDDRNAVENCDLFVEVGMGLEPWADDLTADIPQEKVLVVSDSCMKLGSNPHVWMDPENGKRIATEIAEKLESIDPANADYYRGNLDRYMEELDFVRERIEKLGELIGDRGVITQTPAFSYLLHRMNITDVETLIKMPGSEPSVEDIRISEKAIRNGEAYAVLSLVQNPISAVDEISSDTGAPVVRGTPLLGALGIEHYTDLLMYNADAIYDGIKTGETNLRMNLLENRMEDMGSQISLIALGIIVLILLLVVEAYQIRKLKKGDF